MDSAYKEENPDQEPGQASDETTRPPAMFQRNPEDAQLEAQSGKPAGQPEQGSIAESLRSLAATLEAEPDSDDEGYEEQSLISDGNSLFPRQPRNLAEVGLSKAFLTDLALKIMHYTGTPSLTQLVRKLGLGQTLVQQVLATLQEERLCEILSQSDLFTGNYRYRLSERGTMRVVEALERTRYAGPAPVTAEQYAQVMKAQKERRTPPSRERIKAALDQFVLAPDVADSLARALYSGKTTLLHGLSGNGKTAILETFAKNPDGAVLVPYAVYAYGQVIRVFDPSIHELVEEFDERNVSSSKDEAKLDRRWVLVRRPAVVLGAELGPESMDLAYDPQARFYQAPPHVKAQGGVLVADDLGRQRLDPRDMMSRWLIAVERGWDSLSLTTGEKLTVPYDVQLLFATNKPIDKLVDDALLRRVLYKIELSSPGPQEFAEILRRICRQRGIKTPEGAVERVVERLYSRSDIPPRASYARDLLEVLVEGASFDGKEAVLDEESFERAYSLFVTHRSPATES